MPLGVSLRIPLLRFNPSRLPQRRPPNQRLQLTGDARIHGRLQLEGHPSRAAGN